MEEGVGWIFVGTNPSGESLAPAIEAGKGGKEIKDRALIKG